MASGPVVGEGLLEGGGDGPRPKQRWVENKVYKRKSFKGQKNSSSRNPSSNNNEGSNAEDHAVDNENSSSNKPRIDNNKESNLNLGQTEDGASPREREPVTTADAAASEDSSSLNRVQHAGTSNHQDRLSNGDEEDPSRLKINLSSRSKNEMRELKRKLEGELETVRQLVRKVESKETQIRNGSSQSLVMTSAVNDRVHSEVASVGAINQNQHLQDDHGRARIPNHLVINNSNQMAGDNITEKEKRTPKANPLYRNSEFLLGKDRLPSRSSSSQGKKHQTDGGEFAFGQNKYLKSCFSLLERLMKNKHGWVFNTPVDVESLGLHDYHTIIEHPMDLGTVRSRLNANRYRSPREFARDVRRTFSNAMTYNPKGQDVHTMAEQLSKIFEERWAIIDADYGRELRSPTEVDTSFPGPRTKTFALPPPPPPPGRVSAPKKPRAKDAHKRDMTFEEKQKLSVNLQNLPSEKLDQIVQIMKKRNSSLNQHEDEIEVDIDSVDAETLWELDRFVTNYKKVLSKNKRKTSTAGLTGQEPHLPAATVAHEQAGTLPPVLATHGENEATGTRTGPDRAGSASESSSSTSSSSDSGSSSSDSDSDSSSEDGSDPGQ